MPKITGDPNILRKNYIFIEKIVKIEKACSLSRPLILV